MLKRAVWCVAAATALVQAAEAQSANRILVQVGAISIQPVFMLNGGAVVGVVAPDPADLATGIVRKKLAVDVVYDDIQLTFDDANKTLVEFIDAFLDGRRVSADVIIADVDGRERVRWRATDAQVISISVPADGAEKGHCHFQVTLRPRMVTPAPVQAALVPAKTVSSCYEAVFRVLLDGAIVSVAKIDSLELRGDWISGETRGGFTFPNLRLLTRTKDEGLLGAWNADQQLQGQIVGEKKHSLSVEFMNKGDLPPALLRLNARGVGMVALRRRISNDINGMSEFELYVEEWDRAGRVHAEPPPRAPDAFAGTSAAGDGPLVGVVGAGSFRIKLPTGTLSGTGSLCTIGNDQSFFTIQLQSPDGIGIIGGRGHPLRLGTFSVGGDGDSTIQVGFSRSAGAPNSYTAKRGTLTMTKVGALNSGRLSVVAGLIDGSSEPPDATISGSFTDLPRSC